MPGDELHWGDKLQWLTSTSAVLTDMLANLCSIQTEIHEWCAPPVSTADSFDRS